LERTLSTRNGAKGDPIITAINSEVDYKDALAEIERLIDRNARVGTPDDRLNLLTLLVQDYEQKRVDY
jgi:antitoxin component HigA of HigAB toxin-antitoxin module